MPLDKPPGADDAPHVIDVDPGQEWDKGRVEAFSDAVFAIAITLLVLEIHAPSNLHHLGHALEQEWPAYLAYVTSFLTVGGVWMAHHRLFKGVRQVDSMMMRFNLLLLMLAAFVPFPTGILAEALRAPEHSAQIAVVLYGAVVLAIELVLRAFLHYVASRPELTAQRRPTATSAQTLSGRWWLSPIVVLYAVAIGVGLVGFPKAAAAMYLALAIPGVLFLGTHRHRASQPKAT
jgi:uncharacterized membrane protein